MVLKMLEVSDVVLMVLNGMIRGIEIRRKNSLLRKRNYLF